MRHVAKPIRLSQHARLQLERRGTTEGEIGAAIRTAEWRTAELGRLECVREFRFNKSWNGKRYATKQVRPIFAEEPTELVVITVYVYYYS